MTLNRNQNYYSTIAYGVCLLVLFISSTYLFYNQIMQTNGGYESDLHYYASIAMTGEGDRFLTILLGYIYALTGSVYAMAVYLGLVIVGIVLASCRIITILLECSGLKADITIVRAVSLLTVFSSNIYLPYIHHYFYRRSWDSFAWHSPTQQSMLFFSFVSLIFFLKMFHNYQKKISFTDWLGALVFSAIATWTKPSFFMVFAPALVVSFLIELFSAPREEWLERFRKLFIMGSPLFPAGFIMLFYMFWYGDNVGDSEIHFGLSSFIANNVSFVIFTSRMVCGLAIPLVVCIMNWKRFKELPYRTAILAFLFGFLEWTFIYETGKNANYGNFGWGKQFACLFMFICSYSIVIQNYLDKSFLSRCQLIRKLYFLLLAVLLILMLFTQLYLYQHMLRGGNYMI